MEQRAPRREQETPVRHGGQTETGQTITQEQALSTPEPSRSKAPIQERNTSRFPFAFLVFFLIIAFQIGNALFDSKDDSQPRKPSTTTAKSTPKKPKAPPQAKRDFYQTYVKALTRLAEQGSAEAQWRLGRLYGGNKGLPQNNEQAVFWYHKAAQQGYAPAQYSLGWMYEHGRGVAQNGEQALFWYRKAAEQGLQSARDKIDALEGRR